MSFLAKRVNGGSPLQTFESDWDPFGGLTNVRRTMNTLLDSAMLPSSGTLTSSYVPAIDLYEKDGNYVVECVAPGMKKEDIDIEVSDNRLTISGKHQEEKTEQNTRYHYREMRRGSFSRTVSLPHELDPEKVTANYENGILRIVLPAGKQTQSKKVQVKG